jgi:glycosyltransferase involved in cell wall biosynthesis
MEVGGAEKHLLQVSSALAARGQDVTVFSFQPDGPLRPVFEKSGVTVSGFRPPAWLSRWLTHPRALAWTVLLSSSFFLWITLWRVRPRVIHFYLPAAYIIGGCVSFFGPCAIRIMSRRSMNYYQEKHRLFARLERWLHPRMNFVAGNSNAVMEQLADEGVDRGRLRLIYNGIDSDAFFRPHLRALTRDELGVSSETLVFVIVANLIPYKGHSDLINAFSLIRKSLPKDWCVLIIGRDDGIQSGLQAMVGDLEMSRHFHFLGQRHDVAALLSGSDIGVLCSHEEGFSNAVLEGMAAGLPMVVTDVGGNAEAVLDGLHGYVVPARSPQRLGEALLRLATDEDRGAMGLLGRCRVQERFSVSACIDAYLKVYGEAFELKSCRW